jgi:hypothetical protein
MPAAPAVSAICSTRTSTGTWTCARCDRAARLRCSRSQRRAMLALTLVALAFASLISGSSESRFS